MSTVFDDDLTHEERETARDLITRIRELFNEFAHEFGEEAARKYFTKLGKRPPGRPSGSQNKLYAPNNVREAERKRRKRIDPILATALALVESLPPPDKK